MMELQAALILPQLDTWHNNLNARTAIAKTYQKAFGGLPGLRLLFTREYDTPSWMMFPMFIKQKWDMMIYLEKHGIETREALPLTNQPCYHGYFDESRYPVAKQINETGFYIPCHQYLSMEEIHRVIEAVRGYFEI